MNQSCSMAMARRVRCDVLLNAQFSRKLLESNVNGFGEFLLLEILRLGRIPFIDYSEDVIRFIL